MNNVGEPTAVVLNTLDGYFLIFMTRTARGCLTEAKVINFTKAGN